MDQAIAFFGLVSPFALEIITQLVRILPPLLQNHLFSLGNRGFRGDSDDSLDDSPGGKAAHETTQHLQACTCMDVQESQRNCPEMRKTLGKPLILQHGLQKANGEDRNRTFSCFPKVLGSSRGACWRLQYSQKIRLVGVLPELTR